MGRKTDDGSFNAPNWATASVIKHENNVKVTVAHCSDKSGDKDSESEHLCSRSGSDEIQEGERAVESTSWGVV